MRILHQPPLHMLLVMLAVLALSGLASLTGCNDTGGLGASCESNGECKSDLQCVKQACVARCERATDCGDGYSCSSSGLCETATGNQGSRCKSETECGAGLFCKLDGGDDNNDGALGATCVEDTNGHAIGHECSRDSECRNGTCALGHCVDLCAGDRDCPQEMACLTIPRIEASNALFRGCLPARGVVTWDIPVPAPAADVLIPVPNRAISMSLLMTVADETQLVGATRLTSPLNDDLFKRNNPASKNKLRHAPRNGLSVMQLPASASSRLSVGAYHLSLSSFRSNGQTTGSATPRLKVSLRIGPIDNSSLQPTDSPVLSLHFHFVDLADHPCRADQFPLGTDGKETLSAANARGSAKFEGYLRDLRTIFQNAGIALGDLTYDDLKGPASLDNVTPENVRALLSLGKYSTGINVFFVRGISPVGVLAMGPSPGTAGVKGTAASGVVISLEPLCYGSWTQLARTTAHQLARYMGLYPNRDVSGLLDLIDDSDAASDNLMFFSENGGTKFSPGQRQVLVSSPMVEGVGQ